MLVSVNFDQFLSVSGDAMFPPPGSFIRLVTFVLSRPFDDAGSAGIHAHRRVYIQQWSET